MKFELETFATIEQVRHQIQKCEGKHTQQIAYSSYHDSLTQICFNCKKIRTNIDFITSDNTNCGKSVRGEK